MAGRTRTPAGKPSTLGLLGGTAGLAIAWAGLLLLREIGPSNLPRPSEISLDARSVVFTLLLSLLCGLLFGFIPVLRYVFSPQGVPLLGATRTSSASRERQRGRNLLVIAQVAMALVLLISAVLMIRTFEAMLNVDPGFSSPKSLQICAFRFPESGPRSNSGRTHAEQRPRQTGGHPRRLLGRLRSFGSNERSRTELERNLHRRHEVQRRRASHASLQLCLSRIFSHRGNENRRGSRFRVGGCIRANAGGDGVRRACPRIVGIAERGNRQTIPRMAQHALA